MKTNLKLKIAVLGLILSATLLSAQVTNTYTFSSSPNAEIPDGNPNGILEQLNVSGVDGTIDSIQVNLNILGGYNGDLYAYLAGPQGQTAILLNRPGLTAGDPFGYSDTGFDITLDDNVGLIPNIHYYENGGYSYSVNGNDQVTGTWGSDGINIDPQSAPETFDNTTPSANLTLFDGGDANGTWNLFIADMVPGGGTANLIDFGVVITATATPEPSVLALGILGGAALFFIRRRQKTKLKQPVS
jgi:subtilisin-like proprotein convertase family protein